MASLTLQKSSIFFEEEACLLFNGMVERFNRSECCDWDNLCFTFRLFKNFAHLECKVIFIEGFFNVIGSAYRLCF
jgi:hypothetical protein